MYIVRRRSDGPDFVSSVKTPYAYAHLTNTYWKERYSAEFVLLAVKSIVLVELATNQGTGLLERDGPFMVHSAEHPERSGSTRRSLR